MKFKVLTLFPEMFTSYFSSSIMKRAIGKGLIDVQFINIRDYTKNKYNRCDNKPVGGGAGLIMKVQPIFDCLKNVSTPSTHKIILTPRGKTYNQEKANELAKNYDEILILCGHYEGVDERVYQYFDEEISIGDYILTGGEAAAICLIDSISRLIKGVITEESIDIESFDNNLLEYPQFTEPYEFDNKKIPDILYSGNHEAINKWRLKESLKITKEKRPDLYEKIEKTKQVQKLIKEIESNTELPKREKDALTKGKKFIKE